MLAGPETWRNGIVSRADVAHFIVSQLGSAEFVHRAPVVIG